MSESNERYLGNYKVIRLLGKGSFAHVYLGEHRYLKSQAAIKVLDLRLLEDVDQEQFLVEAQTLASLIHPHIIRVLDFGIEDQIPFLVMSYIPGGSLRQRYPMGSQLSLSEVILLAKQVADALQYAHDHRLIHRDIKPENMLLRHDAEVLLGDFGIAVIAHSSASQSFQKFAGTIAYSAPEQLLGKPRPASDQYALAVVVYEWLTGALPFDGTDHIRLAYQHLSCPPRPLHTLVPDISPQVEEVILKALEKDPHQRFGSVQLFVKALEEAALPVALRPTRPLTLFPESDVVPEAQPSLGEHRRFPRRRLLVGLGGVLGLTAASGGIAWLWSRPSHSSSGLSHAPTLTRPVFRVTPSPDLQLPLYTYHGHADEVDAVAWSPDGTRIASGSRGLAIQVWDAFTGNAVVTHTPSGGAPMSWQPHQQRIASSRVDGTVEIWNALSGQTPHVFPDRYAQADLSWSADGKYLASANSGDLGTAWDASNGSFVLFYRSNGQFLMNCVAWAPQGALLAFGTDGIGSPSNPVQVWEALSHRLITTYHGHQKPVESVAWSPDGNRIASGGIDTTVQIWNAMTGKSILMYTGHSGSVTDVKWSPNGKYVASIDYFDTTVQVWDATTGGKTFTFVYHGHAEIVNAIAWSPDGKYIASASSDHSVQVWQPPTP